MKRPYNYYCSSAFIQNIINRELHVYYISRQMWIVATTVLCCCTVKIASFRLLGANNVIIIFPVISKFNIIVARISSEHFRMLSTT